MFILQRIKTIPFNRIYGIVLYIAMSIQLVTIEGLNVSPIKVVLMGLAPVVFVLRVPHINRAIWAATIYWLLCYFTASFHGEMRFSTLGYMALFLITYIVFYNLLYTGTFTLDQFKKLLKFILLAYGITLLLQQACVIVGLTNVPFLNLVGAEYYAWNRLPTLSCEPSHTARIISAAMLGYIQCLEIEKGKKISLIQLFEKDNRWVTLVYLWMTLTMGSGTGWISFGILCLYFIRLRTFFYVIPIFFCLFCVLQHSENKQLKRAIIATEATLTGNTSLIFKADVSGSVRIIPLVNTLTKTDLNQKESWFGKGTYAADRAKKNEWKNMDRKLGIVEQYGLLGLIGSLILLYSCAIRRFFSIENLYFIVLLLCSLSSEYFTWSMVMVFTAMRYFKKQQENGCFNNHS